MWWQIMMKAGTKQAAGSNGSISSNMRMASLIGQILRAKDFRASGLGQDQPKSLRVFTVRTISDFALEWNI